MSNSLEELIWESENRKDSNIFGSFTKWRKYSDYEIIYDHNDIDPMIVPKGKGKVSLYNPFNVYPNILIDYLNLTTDIVRTLGFEDQSNLGTDNSKEIIKFNDKGVLSIISKKLLEFIKKYGLLYHYFDDDQVYNEMDYIDNNNRLKGRGEGFISEGETVKMVTNRIISDYNMFNRANELNILDSGSIDKYNALKGQKLRQNMSEILSVDNIGLTIDYSGNVPKLAWKYNDLYQAIRIMFIYNLTLKKHPAKLCALDTCNTWFIETRKGKIYCDDRCGATIRQRTHYNKNKLIKED